MSLWRKYKHFIIVFGIFFWVFAKVIGIQKWGSIVLGISMLLDIMGDIIEYEKKIGKVKFSILISIFLVTSVLTALMFIQIGEYFTLSIISEILIIILGLVIDILILNYAIKKVTRT
ncbi:hypothetical protein [Clostridium sp.]|uniref:hypothetical protein n=1 Tax=Clostridium sp. TaxID=1506 RepID=UPI00261F6647|nr:hypothetical protein [uncultured Clostridium sp.]